MAFYDQVRELCERKGTSLTSVVVSLGMSKGSITNWKNGALPKSEVLVRFAEHFNVSTDYLLFGKEEKGMLISKQDREWLELIHRLPADLQEKYRIKLEGYVECFEDMAGDPHSNLKTGTTNSTK